MISCAVGRGEPVMDREAFEGWLVAIRGLTAAQRSQGFGALALSEADAEVGVGSVLALRAAVPQPAAAIEPARDGAAAG